AAAPRPPRSSDDSPGSQTPRCHAVLSPQLLLLHSLLAPPSPATLPPSPSTRGRLAGGLPRRPVPVRPDPSRPVPSRPGTSRTWTLSFQKRSGSGVVPAHARCLLDLRCDLSARQTLRSRFRGAICALFAAGVR